MKNIEIKTSYDEVPYESYPFPQSHPDRLATLGHIFGMSPKQVENCRVLELGCASGGNLIPMAYHLPGSEFVGVDLSGREVEMGQKVIKELNLKNVRIEHESILNIDASWGGFDYIISHGVYSWVPDNVQDRVLAISSENLNPQGIAYVSYNTYPGWHMREMIRRMMLYHTGQFKEPERQVQQARALIDFLARSVPTEANHYGMLLKAELEVIKRSRDYYLYHDHLEEENAPIYFHQFVERAMDHGLQYLGEADFATMLTSGFSKEVSDTLRRISPNIIRTEQYMDFLRNRLFRQTLLCNRDVALKRNLGPDDIGGLLVASAAVPDKEPVDLSSATKQSFRTPRGAVVSTNSPLTKAGFSVLKERWPRAVDTDTLLQEALKKLDNVKALKTMYVDRARNKLLSDLLQCYTTGVVEFRTWQADFVMSVSERPKVSDLARHYISKGASVVNQRHELVNLDPVAQQLVARLDGMQDTEALLEHCFWAVQKGTLVVRQDGKPLDNSDKIRHALKKAIEKSLTTMGKTALLVE